MRRKLLVAFLQCLPIAMTFGAIDYQQESRRFGISLVGLAYLFLALIYIGVAMAIIGVPIWQALKAYREAQRDQSANPTNAAVMALALWGAGAFIFAVVALTATSYFGLDPQTVLGNIFSAIRDFIGG